MAQSTQRHRRLDPHPPYRDLAGGFRAEVHDPLYCLGMQYLLGEHQGSDASTPVEVRFDLDEIPVEHSDPTVPNPAATPPEPVVEAEADDWWTPGRRIRLGRAFMARKEAAESGGKTAGTPLPLPTPGSGPGGTPKMEDARYLATDLPHPYQHLNGHAWDGLSLFRDHPDDPLFSVVPSPRNTSGWRSDQLAYAADFEAKNAHLALRRHDGGAMDWYSVDADGPASSRSRIRDTLVMPSRLRFPGSPAPRWWEIEDQRVDIGGYPPDRGHFATLLLIDLVMGIGDDWFTFPVQGRTGSVLRLTNVRIRDSFDDTWSVAPADDWSFFRVAGLDPCDLLLWPAVTTPLRGRLLEEVLMGVDEDANILWAVENRLEGCDLATAGDLADPPPPQTGEPFQAGLTPEYRYRTQRGLREHWHPYLLEDRPGERILIQGRVANLEGEEPRLLPEARARLLQAEPTAPAVHRLQPTAIPATGLRLLRRIKMVRDVNGNPVLWTERSRHPLAGVPATRLRFDALEVGPRRRPGDRHPGRLLPSPTQ